MGKRKHDNNLTNISKKIKLNKNNLETAMEKYYSEEDVEKEAQHLRNRWANIIKRTNDGDLNKYVVQKEALKNIKMNINEYDKNIKNMKEKLDEIKKVKRNRRLGKRKHVNNWTENLKKARIENNLDKQLSIRLTADKQNKKYKVPKYHAITQIEQKNDYPLVLFQANKKNKENISKKSKNLNNNYEFYPPLNIEYKTPLQIEYKAEQIKSNKQKQNKIIYKNLINGKEISPRKTLKRKSKEPLGRLRRKYRKRNDFSSADD